MAPDRYHSDEAIDVSPLGAPLKFEFSGRVAQNRFLKAAMSERLASWSSSDLSARGVPTPELINVYRRWGEGRFGLILTGNVMLDYDQLEAPGNCVIPLEADFSGPRFEAFQKLAEAGKKEGSCMVAQLSHPGRQVESRIQKDPVSASDVQLEGSLMGMTFAKPHAATDVEIERIIDGFVHAAQYLDKAGFDGIELHAAHGYLLAQFLSQTTNNRTDKYGGSLENRARLLLEIGREVRKRTRSDFILGVKLNSVEFQDRGFSPEEAKTICTLLEQSNFDFVELSGGTYEQPAFMHKKESTRKREAFFLEFADLIAPGLVKTKIYVTGGFKTSSAMLKALEIVDGIGLGRPTCQEPLFAVDILAGKIKSALKLRLDEDDFGLANIVAGSQIGQLGKGHAPVDMSSDQGERTFMEALIAWREKMANDVNMEYSGWVF